MKLAGEGKDTEIFKPLGLPGSGGYEAKEPPVEREVALSEALSCAILVEELTSSVYRRLADCAKGVLGIAFAYIASESSIPCRHI